jgi:hypothetical protein
MRRCIADHPFHGGRVPLWLARADDIHSMKFRFGFGLGSLNDLTDTDPPMPMTILCIS